jgi:hypothetical protein
MDRRAFLRLLSGLGLVAVMPPFGPPMGKLEEPAPLDLEVMEFRSGMPVGTVDINKLGSSLMAVVASTHPMIQTQVQLASEFEKMRIELERLKRYGG